MEKKISQHQPDSEQRIFKIELRAIEGDAPESRTVLGYAAKFNSESSDLGFIEIIEPGAFREAIVTSDVRALFNHDANIVLARTKSGTLKIEEDAIGLRYEFEVPNTTFGNDFLVMLRRGDIDQSSFAFSVQEEEWDSYKDTNGKLMHKRKVKKVRTLYDVSPVTYPAYPETTVSVRSIVTDDKKEDTQNEPQKKDFRRRLLDAIERHSQ